jgi:hypothetical protein
MFEELNKQMMEVKEKLRAKQRLESLLSKAKKNWAKEKARLKKFEKDLKKEGSDVEKLEGESLTGMFYQMLGTKEKKLNKERQELLAAKLKYDKSARSVFVIEREILSSERQLKELGDPDAEYQSILKQKESLILKEDDERLIRLSERIGDLQSDVKEIKEAIDSGNKVLEGLEIVISSLKKAGHWGIIDLIGGGLVVTAIKHSKIDNAKDLVYDVQNLLERFERELSDIKISPESQLGVEMSSFTKFADYIFDGLIFDWVVQSKIRKSLNSAVEMKENVTKIVSDLQGQLEKSETRRRAAEKEKIALIEKAY